MVKLIWAAVLLLPLQGPLPTTVEDSTKFKDRAACEEFAKSHKGRMPDWFRGAFGLGWEVSVSVAHSCGEDGQPT